MAINFTSFFNKYGELFTTLTQTKFELFLPQAMLEINQINWGVYADVAAEMKMGCLLTLASPILPGASEIPAAGVKSIDFDGELAITYSDSKKSSDCWFCQEYDRLLNQVKGLETPAVSATKGSHYGGDRTDDKPLQW